MQTSAGRGVVMYVHTFRPDVPLPARFAKRLFDVVVSATLLLMVFPAMVLLALLIRLESAGPIFRRQLRIGEHGQPFALLTFRTTYDSDDRQDTGQHTHIGKIFSRFGLDRLPQLINVLRGDMSCVGPRPKRFTRARPGHSDMAIPAFQHRHAVKPGLTGWAQVQQDTQGTTGEQARSELKYDLKYVDQQSLFFDVWILGRTIRLVFTGRIERQPH